MDDFVKAITTFDGDLIAGAFFNVAGGVPVSRLARWDGSSWSSVGGGGGRSIWPSKKEAIEWTLRFMEAHKQHWPGWEGETEVRQIF